MNREGRAREQTGLANATPSPYHPSSANYGGRTEADACGGPPKEARRADISASLLLLSVLPATMAVGPHPFPFRTRPLSPHAPMILLTSGKVGRRRVFLENPRPASHRAGAFCLGHSSHSMMNQCVEFAYVSDQLKTGQL